MLHLLLLLSTLTLTSACLNSDSTIWTGSQGMTSVFLVLNAEDSIATVYFKFAADYANHCTITLSGALNNGLSMLLTDCKSNCQNNLCPTMNLIASFDTTCQNLTLPVPAYGNTPFITHQTDNLKDHNYEKLRLSYFQRHKCEIISSLISLPLLCVSCVLCYIVKPDVKNFNNDYHVTL